MPLLRGFAQIDEKGRVQVPSHLRRQMGLAPGEPFEVEVVRVKNTGRRPRMFLHRRGTMPFISPQEVLFRRGDGHVAEDGSLTLPAEIVEAAGLSVGCVLEIKIMGAAGAPWSVVHNRGVPRNTTLQERLGARRPAGGRRGRWDRFVLEY